MFTETHVKCTPNNSSSTLMHVSREVDGENDSYKMHNNHSSSKVAKDNVYGVTVTTPASFKLTVTTVNKYGTATARADPVQQIFGPRQSAEPQEPKLAATVIHSPSPDS